MEVVQQILAYGGPLTALVLAFGLLNLATLWLVLRWADAKQRRLVRAFRGSNTRLIRAFTETQAGHDRHLVALGQRFERVEEVVEDLAGEVRRRGRYAATPEQRGTAT